MNCDRTTTALQWDAATGLMHNSQSDIGEPQGAFIPDTNHNRDHVAVVYPKGQNPPEITIRKVSGSVHTVLADGVAVAVIARADGPAVSADDVLLVERHI
ncbi:hypothetical protein OS190_07925 [Sulfitobacter sp. F26204]|uniref:hypothetical protein n=1 Tax=Sulfitobacter sp. F26204 TaxID=2996014 RepID=UPI00225DE2D8|nr:hypothetical protein [Sulfitobacter sp. F26204]MCX7559497.1 hypothetical protein [Sulfitobacter sp. F26204]